jgi:hypothetical protein
MTVPAAGGVHQTSPGDAADAGEIDVTLIGTRFALAAADPFVAAALRRLLAPLRTPPYAVHDGPAPRRVVSAPGVEPVLAVRQALAELNTAAVTGADCFAVHAGVVASGSQAVAFPGPSGVGKSTLTAACLLAGLDYVSDEALCVRWDGSALLPYPRPIALSRWSAAAVGRSSTVDEELVTAAELGAAVSSAPLTLAHVVLLERGDGSAVPALVPVPRRDAVSELLRRSFTHWRDPQRAFLLAHALAARAGTWRLTLGDPGTAAELVAALIRPG